MKRKKFFKFIIGLAICSLIMTGCSSNTSKDVEKEEKITLKVATYVATVSPIYKYLTESWMEKVKEITEGKVDFEVYPGEQLGKAQDLLQLTQNKVTDISIFPVNYFPDQMPISNVLAGFPNLSTTSLQGSLAYYDLIQSNNELLETDFLKNGIRPITTNVSPTYEIWTTGKEIRVPKDVKGLKLRTPGGIANEVYQNMGAVPVSVTHTDTYEALEKGVIEAASYSSVAVEQSGTIDLLKYALFIHLGTAIHGLVINEQVWQKLPEDVQKAMIKAGEEVVKTAGENYDKDTQAFNAEFEKVGKVIELTEKERATWIEAHEEFIESWLKKHKSDGLPYEDVLNDYKKILTKYE